MLVSLPTYTLIDVFLSLVGVFAGLVVVGGLMAGVRFDRWVAFFFAATVLTNVTGFGFPFVKVLPSHVVGALSLVVLPVAIAALYWKRLDGTWRKVFVILTVLGLWLNVFVLLAQIFQKTPILAALAPEPSAPAFAVTQGLVLLLFIVLGWASLKGYGGAGVAGRTPTAVPA